MSTSSTDFAKLVTGFLTEYLPLQRNYSNNTILSYRDTFKLFLKFISEIKGIPIQNFRVKDFDRVIVIEFLEWYRLQGVRSSTANQRLAAIKAFAGYAQLESVDLIAPLMDVTCIKAKKTASREVLFLDANRTKQLINAPDLNTVSGFRHRVVLTLLYDSGCRVQELCDLVLSDVVIGENTTVRLHGKGQKTRTVIVSDETGKLLKEYLQKYRKNFLDDYPLITNRLQQKMDRDGVGYIVSKYAKNLHSIDPSFPLHVHCHMLRHSKAMHMLDAGINIVYIRDFLGHEDISTTMVYLQNDNRLKKDAVNKLAPKLTDDSGLPDWNKDKSLMDFLNSLK